MNNPKSEPNPPQDRATASTAPTGPSPNHGQSREPREEARRILYGMGFAAKEHIALAEKLLAHPPTENFERVILLDKHAKHEQHLDILRKLVKKVRTLDMWTDDLFARCQERPGRSRRHDPASVLPPQQAFAEADHRLQSSLLKFAFNWRAIEDMALFAAHIGEKLQVLLDSAGGSPTTKEPATPDRHKLDQLEKLVRMSAKDYCTACARLKAALEGSR